MNLTIVTALTGLTVLIVIVELLRRRQLREKYGILWIGVGLVMLPLSVFPQALNGLSSLIGIASGVSMALFFAVVFLLLTCIHLSWEVSRLEEETRILAEDIALIHAKLESNENAQ
ncbi:hypothetical protein Lfu02_47670 [Longispora fulva]|uniref:DUF2304 domain-containing protein n=1 Tax=Longispora fulva TaxID=619741 RepID=A0A8J7GJV4_9ACTN|nr:DUF2304 domain-containing protein [Longispora fulva]MBG6138142.1 hypothetical protein [Longispora fulva]GIG60395.1 hypothetical protein Lfu02_47670 [Longispora fulva]